MRESIGVVVLCVRERERERGVIRVAFLMWRGGVVEDTDRGELQSRTQGVCIALFVECCTDNSVLSLTLTVFFLFQDKPETSQPFFSRLSIRV